MKLFTLLLLSISCLHGSCQVIIPTISWDGVLEYSFQQDFIVQKKIKRIDAELSSKNPSQKIQPSTDKKYFQFDSIGFQTEYYNRKKLVNLELTTHNLSQYKEGRIVTSTQKDEVGYFKKYYTYYTDTTYIHTYRSENYPNETTSKTLDSTLINTVILMYSDDKKRVFNKNGIHTKSEYAENNALDLIVNETLEYKLSKKKAVKSYTYNESGLASEVWIKVNGTEKQFNYFYDKHDVISKIETWQNESCIKRLEFIYNSKGWIDSTILQNTENNHIKITKFTYTLY